MALKDKSQLVKMYAMVNIQKYNIVATGTSPREVLSQYREMMAEEGIVDDSGEEIISRNKKKITVIDIQYITMDGETYIYLRDEEDILYKKKIADDETLMLIQTGDHIEAEYEEHENKIYDLISWK